MIATVGDLAIRSTILPMAHSCFWLQRWRNCH
jgi:hypothetical protein